MGEYEDTVIAGSVAKPVLSDGVAESLQMMHVGLIGTGRERRVVLNSNYKPESFLTKTCGWFILRANTKRI